LVNGYRDYYHPYLTKFEESVKIAGIPGMEISYNKMYKIDNLKRRRGGKQRVMGKVSQST